MQRAGGQMTTRRELFPSDRGGGRHLRAAPVVVGASRRRNEPELRRVSYQSARTGADRDYFVYLPRGSCQRKSWPVMLFLHGNGERGDGKGGARLRAGHGPITKPGSSVATCPS